MYITHLINGAHNYTYVINGINLLVAGKKGNPAIHVDGGEKICSFNNFHSIWNLDITYTTTMH